MIYLFAWAIFAPLAQAADAPVVAPAPAPVQYELEDLKPSGIAESPAAGGTRLHLQFRDAEGTHYIVYEEAAAVAPLKMLGRLEQAMSRGDYECSLELECTEKAYCTEDCHQHFYEMTNAPNDPAFSVHNRCHLLSYTCELPRPVNGAAPTASAVPPPSLTPVAADPAGQRAPASAADAQPKTIPDSAISEALSHLPPGTVPAKLPPDVEDP